MIKYKLKTFQQQGIDDILCNKCGKSLKTDCGFIGLTETRIIGQFCSTNLRDGDIHSFSLCEECLEALFSTFIIPTLESRLDETELI